MTYAISDLHGQYKLFQKLLEEINFSTKDELYILGDIIDRGPMPLEIYEYIIRHNNIHLLIGNHERMFLDFAGSTGSKFNNPDMVWSRRTFEYYYDWMNNGGRVTYEALLKKSQRYINEFIKYLHKLPYFYKLNVNGQNFFLCHSKPIFYANMDFDTAIQVNIKDEGIIWNREYEDAPIPDGYIIIHGHTPVRKMVEYCYGQAFDIDCGAYKTNRLCCLCLENLMERYIEL